MNRRGGLGRGLAALIPPGEGGPAGTAPADGRAWLAELPIGSIRPNPRQPRDVFDEDELEGLATSIRDMGLLQPVVVRPLGGDDFELIAGERRLRASKLAGLEQIPAVVRTTDDSDLLKEALVENIHRVQLNPLEEAAAYQQMLEDFDFTQEELASKLGKSRPAISNALRLLTLPPAVQRRVAAGVLSAGHAKALLALADDPDKMDRLASRVIAEGMSVRALEETIRLTLLEPADPGAARSGGKAGRMTAPGLVDLQHDLSDALKARVRITMGARKGKLQVEFTSVDDLERIVGVIARGLEDGTDVAVEAAIDAPAAAPEAASPPEEESEADGPPAAAEAVEPLAASEAVEPPAAEAAEPAASPDLAPAASAGSELAPPAPIEPAAPADVAPPAPVDPPSADAPVDLPAPPADAAPIDLPAPPADSAPVDLPPPTAAPVDLPPPADLASPADAASPADLPPPPGQPTHLPPAEGAAPATPVSPDEDHLEGG